MHNRATKQVCASEWNIEYVQAQNCFKEWADEHQTGESGVERTKPAASR